MNKKKVVFLTYIPSPYRVSFFNELSKYTDLSVVYYTNLKLNLGWKDENLVQGYNYTYLNESPKIKGYLELFKVLKKNKKNIIVVGGYAMIPEIIAIFYMKIFRIKFILNSDGGFITRGFFKTIFKKILISSPSYWLSSGVNTTKTLINYGANRNNVFEYHFTTLFKSEVLLEVTAEAEIKELRLKYNLKPNIPYLVFVGQLIHRKGLDILIDAFRNIKYPNTELLLIGDGDKLNDLRKSVMESNLEDKIHFLGKMSKDNVLEYLRLSDVFVFPSREDIWGLVLNEAISNGLPVVSTKQVGASFSLIKNNLNGFIIDSESSKQLSDSINMILFKDIKKNKEESLKIAADYTIELMVDDHLKLFNKFYK